MFKNYKSIELIYQGNESNIFRAVSIPDENGVSQNVILKTITNPFPKPLEIGRLHHEYHLLENLKMKGVPEVLSLEQQDGVFGIVMKDFELKKVKPDFKKIENLDYFFSIAIQLCQVISGIHAQQIIHKDIKPDNILISEDGFVQLIDFGLAKKLLSGTQEATGIGLLEGSLPYISPEQTGRMNRAVDYRSDLYSVGITLFEWLTGSLPFNAIHPLEWVHAHLAQKAPDPRAINSNIPEPLAFIILKLLAKNTEDRYQSAYGLQKDLENCAHQWKEKGKIKTFKLAENDNSGLYMLPSKLYGREKELELLSGILNHLIEERKPQMIIVSGYSGIGKTALVQEARQQITIAKGSFTSGKFDQLNKGIPYSGFIQAFSELAKQLLAEKEETLNRVREDLLGSLGKNAQIINQLIPAFEKIIGTHPTPPPLLPEETSNRFLQTLITFVKTLAHPGNPLIIFIDDLQWADVASLSLLELLASDGDLQNLCLIGSYRSNEVDDSHPLTQSLKKVKQWIPFNEIILENLQKEDVCALLTDTFKRPVDDTKELAELLIGKTEGNPFFLSQSMKSLFDNGQIQFNPDQGGWFWDIASLSQMHISENVIDLMVSKIRKLSVNAQQCLKFASCIGYEFSMSLLMNVAPIEALLALEEVIDQGLVSSMDENYIQLSAKRYFLESDSLAKDPHIKLSDSHFKFLHDRVQQAAYSLLSEKESKIIHYDIGKYLIDTLNETDIKDQVFIICNHRNKAVELLKGQKERNALASLNLLAGRKATDATAYSQALDYVTVGIRLLPSDVSNSSYALWQGLYQIKAQSNYLLGNHKDAEIEYRLLLEKSRSRMDKLQVYRSLVDMYSSEGNQQKVIENSGAALALFGVKIPKNPIESKLRIFSSIIELKWKLRKLTKEDIIHAPQCNDEDHNKLAELLLEAGPSIYLANQDLFAWLILFEVRSALRLGNSPTTALGYMGYGLISNTAFGDIDLAFKMADIGQALNNEYGNPFPHHKLRFVFLNFFAFWKENIENHLEEFMSLSKTALAAGDYLYLGLNYYNSLIYRFALGHPLPDIEQEANFYFNHLSVLHNTHGYDFCISRFQTSMLLQGKPLLPWDIEKPDKTLNEKLQQFREKRNLTNIMLLHVSIFECNYFLGSYQDMILETILLSNENEAYLSDAYAFTDYCLYHSLCAYKVYEQQDTRTQRKLKKIIYDHLKQLKTRYASAPINHEHHYLLLSAIYNDITGRKEEALDILDSLLPKCDARRLPHIAAIAKELIGKANLARGKERIAHIYLQDSILEYSRWGAMEKVKLMYEEYPLLELQSRSTKGGEQESIDYRSLQTETSHGLDLASLMKSASTISGEIVLNNLLPSMISIVVENAGAQVGYLVLEKEAQLVLSVKRHASEPEAMLINDILVSESEEVSQTVIQYTHRSKEMLILNNAYFNELFKNDPYIKANKTKSVLCVPIVHKHKFIGAIYLENNLITHAFSEERVNVMKILSSQIAVSLDNALLYRNLEDSLDKQVKLTEAYSRFTPESYLKFLGHTSILDVKLGDHRIGNMTVLFSDVRSYTSIAEQYTPEENFKFLSDYLEKMTGIVALHHGIVNQLLGDGILAFFDKPEDALNASIQMQHSLQIFAQKGKSGEEINISAGIGLHSGDVIIGIVGNNQSMDTGILSDTVNAAARIEGLTKQFGASILLSETLVSGLSDEAKNMLRFIARVQMKGKNIPIGIYECFEGDAEAVKMEKRSGYNEYHNALQLYTSGQFDAASKEFQNLSLTYKHDALLKYYKEKATSMLQNELPENWSAVEVFDVK